MIVICLLLALVAVFYYFIHRLKKNLNYWKDRGVTQLNPDLIYGDMKKHIMRQLSSGEISREIYYKFKKMGVKFGGVYNYNRPVWFLVDPEIIKLVIFKDFQHFSAHNPKYSNTLLFNNIFHMDGEIWKDLRRKLTPTFTSGKMKMMFEMLKEKNNGLTALVGDMVKSGQPTEIKELLARYTTDVIGTCAFGIECDSLNDINSEFFQRGQDIFRILTPKSSPSLLKLFLMTSGLVKSRFPDMMDVEDFFRGIVNEAVKYREQNKVVRKDFLHLMIQLKNKGTITDILNEKEVFQKAGEASMSMEEVAGQCMLFFTAGFETSSTTMSYALLELTQNRDIQDKLRKEIREVLKKHDGNLTYEALQEMHYLENVINETLRKYPPLAVLPRMCTKRYHVPNTDVVIEKGTTIQIPIWAIQNDPQYFPEPQKFDPDRFSPANKSKIVDCTYMPFGDGPRQCLGLRFGMMQSKAGIASLINRYSFTLNQKTSYPPKFSSSAPILSVDGGVWLDAKEVK